MGEADEGGDERGEDRVAEMRLNEGEAVQVEGGVAQVFDAGDVEAAVLGVGVVAVNREGERGGDGSQSYAEEAVAGRRVSPRKKVHE